MAAATLRASASTSFTDMLAAVVPHGLILPVLPGTRHLTIGGAVAADVHGKNQRRDGSHRRLDRRDRAHRRPRPGAHADPGG